MTAFFTFVVANSGLLIGAFVVVLNILIAAFDKNERVKGFFSAVRSFVERFAFAQPANSKGSIKFPGQKAGVKVVPDPIFSE